MNDIYKLIEQLSEAINDMEIEYIQVRKNGMNLDGIRIVKEGAFSNPIIYPDEDFYNLSLDEQIQHICELFKSPRFDKEVFVEHTSRDYILGNVLPRVYSEKEIPFMENKIYKRFLDMVIIYYVPIENNAYHTTSYTLTEDMLWVSEITEEEIFRHAIKNISHNVRIEPLNRLLSHAGFVGYDDFIPFLVITTDTGMYGAACMLCEEIRDCVGEILGEPYIILPSSIHEFLAIPVGVVEDLDIYRSMVYEINRSQVDICDRLTDSVYICEDGCIDVYKGGNDGRI